MGFLAGKKLLITGVLSNRSIAYGIAKCCHAQGAQLAFSYVGERFKDRITEFAADFDSKLVFDCDVTSDEQLVYQRLYRLTYGHQRRSCIVSHETIGQKTGLSESTVKRVCRKLVADRIISSTPAIGGRQNERGSVFELLEPSDLLAQLYETQASRAEVRETRVRQAAATQAPVRPVPMKDHENTSENMVYRVREIALRLREARGVLSRDALRAALEGQGVGWDEGVVERATDGMW